MFALVTDGGYLIVYDIRLFARPLVRIAAHSGDATTVDWHPTQPYIVATGKWFFYSISRILQPLLIDYSYFHQLF